MLKDRFFEHIRDAFTLYHGAGKDSIDDFYYTLSTSAMLSGEAGFDNSRMSMIYITHLRGLTTGILIKMNM